MKRAGLILLVAGLILMAVVILLPGCKEENEPAPSLPPQSSFVMDFSDFSNPDDTLGTRGITTYQNWGYSYANVVIWQTFLTVGLAVPVAAFNESFNHEAVYHPDEDNWTWSYNVTVGFVVYEAELTGYLVADSVAWEMRVTKGTEFSDFLWYYGRSAIGGSGGYWILQENPLNPNPLVLIDWHKYADGTAEISYTNIRPEVPENGTYIFYGTTLNDFNRFYHIYNKVQDNLTEIEWSSVNKNGHVKDPLHFGDDLWHCWDGSLMDVVCP
ncbi:MAG: hypothetical protein RBS55_01110 [Bacteroidales bacterium]|jgi:hypothetical protein|nr:hypothetical protein [Bacteroidales bacterium]